MKYIYTLILSLIIISCGDDEPVLEPIEVMIETNLEAMTTSGPGQPPAGDFVKYSFSEQSVVEGDNWDIAFRATKILVNGDLLVRLMNQAERVLQLVMLWLELMDL